MINIILSPRSGEGKKKKLFARALARFEERKQELATLKVLGFYNNEVTMYVYRENIVLTLMGSVFGVLLGWILHRFIIVTVEIESVMFGRNIDLSSFLFAFLLTVAFSCIVNGAMYFKLKKIDMVESLKSVE